MICTIKLIGINKLIVIDINDETIIPKKITNSFFLVSKFP
jgi:hypothetical protein